MADKLDKETQKLLIEQERISNFVKGDDWAWLKGMLADKILDVQSVLNVDETSPEAMAIDIKSRRAVVEILREVIVQVEGSAEQAKVNIETMNPRDNGDIVEYHP